MTSKVDGLSQLPELRQGRRETHSYHVAPNHPHLRSLVCVSASILIVGRGLTTFYIYIYLHFIFSPPPTIPLLMASSLRHLEASLYCHSVGLKSVIIPFNQEGLARDR
jgi:hypothetical protein